MFSDMIIKTRSDATVLTQGLNTWLKMHSSEGVRGRRRGACLLLRIGCETQLRAHQGHHGMERQRFIFFLSSAGVLTRCHGTLCRGATQRAVGAISCARQTIVGGQLGSSPLVCVFVCVCVCTGASAWLGGWFFLEGSVLANFK